MDRTDAVILYQDYFFMALNHQDCLLDIEKRFGLKDTVIKEKTQQWIDDHLDELSTYTYEKSMSEDLYCFSVFEGKYLIANTKNTLFDNLECVRKLAEEMDYELGYYENYINDDIVLI